MNEIIKVIIQLFDNLKDFSEALVPGVVMVIFAILIIKFYGSTIFTDAILSFSIFLIGWATIRTAMLHVIDLVKNYQEMPGK